ncbi:MAG: RidA family protein [Anaerolineae bacterium]|nr:RidA family protein [Anaerolineae bacterium]
MQKTILNPETLAPPRGYSNAILTQGGRVLFLAGQTGMDATGKIANPFDLIDQFHKTLENMQTVLRQAGGSMTDIVKLTIYVTDKRAYHAQRSRIGEVYREYFGKYFPAMTLIEVKGLYDQNAMIEIEGIAVIP